MKRQISILAVLIMVVALLSACSVLRAPEEASAPIEAVPLDVQSETEVDTAEEIDPESEMNEGEEVAAIESDSSSEEEEPEEEAVVVEEAAADEEPVESEPEVSAAGSQVYTISQADSQVRFELNEMLAGQPKTVVGVTDQVAGEIALDLSDLSTAQVGVILVNARGFATDSNFRNRAIQNRILHTGLFEFVTFTPNSIDGMPTSAAVGEEVSFSISGDLTILDTTLPATFEVTATAVTETQISGSASTIVSRQDYDLQIPSVPDVADVEEEVELYIDFVANTS